MDNEQDETIQEEAPKRLTAAEAIKAKCLDCCCYQPLEVKLCPATTCPLWIYRHQEKKPRSEAQLANDARNRERMKAMREAQMAEAAAATAANQK